MTRNPVSYFSSRGRTTIWSSLSCRCARLPYLTRAWVSLCDAASILFSKISIPGNIADLFGIRNNGEITVTKVCNQPDFRITTIQSLPLKIPSQLDKDSSKAEYVEFAFQDQYLGRNEMWRLGQHLVGKCVYVDQDISFIGVIAAKVTAIHVGGHRVGFAPSLPHDF